MGKGWRSEVQSGATVAIWICQNLRLCHYITSSLAIAIGSHLAEETEGIFSLPDLNMFMIKRSRNVYDSHKKK